MKVSWFKLLDSRILTNVSAEDDQEAQGPSAQPWGRPRESGARRQGARPGRLLVINFPSCVLTDTPVEQAQKSRMQSAPRRGRSADSGKRREAPAHIPEAIDVDMEPEEVPRGRANDKGKGRAAPEVTDVDEDMEEEEMEPPAATPSTRHSQREKKASSRAKMATTQGASASGGVKTTARKSKRKGAPEGSEINDEHETKRLRLDYNLPEETVPFTWAPHVRIDCIPSYASISNLSSL